MGHWAKVGTVVDSTWDFSRGTVVAVPHPSSEWYGYVLVEWNHGGKTWCSAFDIDLPLEVPC